MESAFRNTFGIMYSREVRSKRAAATPLYFVRRRLPSKRDNVNSLPQSSQIKTLYQLYQL